MINTRLKLSFKEIHLSKLLDMAREPGKVAELFTARRKQQVEEKGYDAAHDDQHIHGELSNAAACLAATRPVMFQLPRVPNMLKQYEDPWPFEDWDGRGDKDVTAYHGPEAAEAMKSRINELVDAGTFITAEIERLMRAMRTCMEVAKATCTVQQDKETSDA